jgi:hypothetical protein
MSTGQQVMNEEAINAIERFIASFTIPIMYEFKGGDGILGTGVLFEIGGMYFVITASHLFDPKEFLEHFGEEFDPEKLACPDWRYVKPEQPTTFGKFELCRSVQTGFDHDAAFLELKEPDKIKRLKNGWTFLTIDQVGLPTDEELYFLAGYPMSRADAKEWLEDYADVTGEFFNASGLRD